MPETTITIKELNELKLVGFRVLCSDDQYADKISQASLRLNERINEIEQVKNPSQQYGAFIVENETADEDGYWVCVEVKDYENIPRDMAKLTIPPQKYAVIKHIGSNQKIRASYNELHKWIEENNYIRLKNKWHLEKYYIWNNTENIHVELMDTIK
ncbi:GyrI-like domain-containing protein [Bacillus niameyensis]|uniref:GyrI-like domain-containing protein n=1 Tax=Bacillus niameyensis TaxID=1522308 RepID=UPI0007814CE7|nr:GyrI-like domain-containing protein [Bacillus niameyensis]